jgi:hypothetical protein
MSEFSATLFMIIIVLQYAVELQLTVVPQKSKLTIWAIQAHTIS